MKTTTLRLIATTFGIGLSVLSGVTGQAQGPVVAAPINNWEFIDHSSTFGEGMQRGYASVLRGAGELAYLDSLAAVNYQEAYKRALENRVAYTKAVLEIKSMRADYRERYGARPFVGEARRKAMESYMPKKLSAAEYNSESGQITWPHILRQSEYSPICKEINEIFASRTFENSGDGSPTHLELTKLTKSLAALLRENINSMSAEQYIYAAEFIRSINLEAKSVVPPKNGDVNNVTNEAQPEADQVKPDSPAKPVKVKTKV
jgi:hypothetical protein